MDTISVSKFKATCLAVLQRVKRSKQPILITRYGEPIAELKPPSPPASRANWLGGMQGRARIVGNVVAPALEPKAWSAQRK
jgi:antitoxin (DNA-binding transcriptional repressor) of toxin-antitoxin stability system